MRPTVYLLKVTITCTLLLTVLLHKHRRSEGILDTVIQKVQALRLFTTEHLSRALRVVCAPQALLHLPNTMASFTMTARCPTRAVAGRRILNRGISGVRVANTRPRFVVRAADAEVLDKVQNIVKDQLGLDDVPDGEQSFVDDLGADSLDTVELIMALEEEFDIDIAEEEAETIKTVGDAADMIAAEMAKA